MVVAHVFRTTIATFCSCTLHATARILTAAATTAAAAATVATEEDAAMGWRGATCTSGSIALQSCVTGRCGSAGLRLIFVVSGR